jgi:hypothetical protein
MKLTPMELATRYAARGINRSDLLSSEPLDVSALPSDVVLADDVRSTLRQVLALWNGMDALTKIDAAQSAERRVLKGRDPQPMRVAFAWAAYLLLGRIRGCEQRREIMHRVACGLNVAMLRPRKPGKPRKH